MAIPSTNFTTLSLTQLNDRWRLAAANENSKGKQLLPDVMIPEQVAYQFTFWNIERKLIDREIERRADLLPTEVLMYLIETGQTFSFLK